MSCCTSAEVLESAATMTMSTACAEGFRHGGTPTGVIEPVCGRECYVANKGASTSACLLFFHDACGFKSVNNQLLADAYGKALGIPVFLPDFFQGAWIPETGATKEFGLEQFLAANSREKKTAEVESFTRAVKQDLRFTKVGAVGYCWGGWCVWHVGGIPGMIDAAVTAHISLGNPEEINKLTIPTLMIACENDFMMSEVQLRVCEKNMAKLAARGTVARICMYYGMSHGFASRGCDEDPIVNMNMLMAKDEVISFVAHTLKL